jgi:hypothetical protein
MRRLASCLLAGALWLAPRLAAAQTSAPPEQGAWMHVDGPRFTKVFGRPSAAVDWIQVCSAPCDERVPLNWEYQMRARGMKPSTFFELDATAGQSVVVHLHPAYSAWVTGGIVAIATGASVAVIGFPAVLIRSIGCGPIPGAPTAPGYNGGQCSQETNTELGIVAAVSASLVALGTVAIVTNQSTTVSQDDGTDMPAPREPVWHTAERRDQPALPATLGAPLVTLRF